CRSESEAEHTSHNHANAGGAGDCAQMAKDPVCGMNVDAATAKHIAEHSGQKYYFCSEGCKSKFVADTGQFLSSKHHTPPHPTAQADAGAIYTCQMHPEVRQTGPGSCPICGMALEPEMTSPVEGPNPELADMTRRFWIALIFALPVVILEMGRHLFNLHMLIGQQKSNWA